MKRLVAFPVILTATAFVVAATAFVAAQQQMQVPARPAPMGVPGRDGGPQMAKGTGVISGSVTSVDGGRPMRRALVRLQAMGAPGTRSTVADDRGNFEFKELPVGEFTLRANKPGYLESIYGQKHPGNGRPGTPLSLKEGQRLEKLTVLIPKGGVLTGTIVDDIGEPVFGVSVRALRYASRAGERTLVTAGAGTTDDRGIYRIPALPQGDYVLMAMPRNDAGAGIDEVRAAIEEMAATGAAGGISVGGGGGAMAFNAMSPGATDNPPASGYAPVFFPSTTLASAATTIALAAAEEKPGLDIQLQLVPLGVITGVVVGDPRAVSATTVQLSDSNTGLPGLTAKTARPDASGRFTFNGVAPGQYNLTAKSGGMTTIMSDGGGQTMMFMTREVGPGGPGGRGGEPPAPPMWAKAEVSVDGRTKTETALVLQSGMTVAGRVAFDGTGDVPTDFTQLRIILGSAAVNGMISGSSNARVEPDGRFRMTDVMPGRYRFTATPPRGWRPKSVVADGRDALDFLLEVKPSEDQTDVVLTYTNKPAELSGTLQDSSGQVTSAYTIILFAAEQQYWTPQSRRIVSTRPSNEGRFSFRDLPAGDYRLVALEDVEPDSWFDPNVLKTLINGSMSVTITAGEKKAQDIKISK